MTLVTGGWLHLVAGVLGIISTMTVKIKGSPNKVMEVDTVHHRTIEIQCLVVETIGDTPVVTIHTGQGVIIKSVHGLLHQGSPERCYGSRR